MNEKTGDAPLQILLVEDNLTDVLLLEESLAEVRGVNITLTHVQRLDEAMARLQAEYFDAVLLDLGLPDCSGLETFTRTQSRYPSVPILVLSGLDDETIALTAVRDGAQDYLVKGKLDSIMLTRTIRYAIERKRTAEKLVNSELGYRRLFEAARDGILILDAATGQITEANPWMEELLGYPVTDFLGKRLWEISPFREKEASLAAFRTLQEKGYIHYEDLPLMTRDGQQIYVEFISNVYGVGERKVIQCNIRDITERKKADEALQITTRKIVTIWESMTDAFFSLDTEWRFTHVNPQATQLLQKQEQEMIGESIWESFPEAVGSRFEEMYRKVAQQREKLTFEEFFPPLNFWFEVHAYPSAIGLSVYFRDITSRKKAEETRTQLTIELQQQRQRLNEILSSIPGVVWEAWGQPDAADQRMDYVSDYVTTMLGYSVDEWLATPNFWLTIVHPDDQEKATLAARVKFNTGKSLTGATQFRWITKDGRTLWVETQSVPIHDEEGKPVGMRGVTMDITERKRAEEERDRFFVLSLDMLGIAGEDGHFKRVNPAFTEILGYTDTEILAQPFLSFVHPEDQASTLAAVSALSEGIAVIGFENRYRTKDGSWRWLEWKSVSDPDEGLVYAAARDVTQRKESEAALRQMHNELEVRVEERTAELAKANAALQIEISERKEAEAETRTRTRQQEAIAEMRRQALTDIDMDSLLTATTSLITATLGVELSAVLELMPDKSAMYIRNGIGWKTNTDGHLVSATTDSQAGYALSADAPVIVTDLRAETRFKPSELLLEEGIISGITIVVRGYEQPFGVLGAHTVHQRNFTQDDVHFLQAISNVLAAAIERRRIETEIRELNTQLKETNERLRIENIERQMTLAALREGAEVLQQAKEEAERARENAEVANRAKSEFLSRMSHELRTPLNAILGFGQILEMRNQDASPRQQDNIQQILRAGRHLLDLINEVLDIARIEAGHLSLSPEPVTVGPIVRDVLDVLRPLAVTRQIHLLNNVSKKHGDQHVLADQQRFKQVLLNFLSNAVKYNCDGGSVIVSCELSGGQLQSQEANNAQEYLRILVQDSGPGLTTDELPRLFMPFERLSAARSQVEGTGIGLSLCKQLMEAMNGRVGVESEVGQGSTFWLELPLVKGAISLGRLTESNLTLKPDAPIFDSPRTILYIEDNLSNIKLIEHIISDLSRHIRLLPVMQGSLGLELATEHRPDLILLDINLPDIMGDVVLSRLKSNPLTQDIPVVMLSADATERQIERLLDAGAVHYLTKPLDIGQFYSVLRENLKGTSQAKD